MRSDTATLSDGSWSGSLPITNMQDRRIGKVARTTDATTASTKINISYPDVTRIKLACLANHNLSIDAEYRIRASNEASTTNQFLYSEQFNNSYWSKSPSPTDIRTLTNAIAAPDGAVTAERIVENSTSVAQRNVGKRTCVITAGSENTVSIFLKKAERSHCRVSLAPGNGTSGSVYTIVDLDMATVSAVTLTGGAISGSASITAYDDDFYRVSVTGVLAPDVTNAGLLLYLQQDDTVINYAGVIGWGLYAWGAQFESGNAATSYYPTTTTTGTRPYGYIDSWQTYDYDSGVLSVWPAIYTTLELEWEDDNWWTGQLSDADLAGYTWNLIHIFPENMLMKQYKIELFDAENTDGYIEIGRLFMSPAYQPTRNMEYGESIGYETNTRIAAAPSGTEYFDAQNSYRVARFRLGFIDTNEAMTNIFEMQRILGNDGEVLYIFDPDDTNHKLRRSFLGRLRELSPIEQPYLEKHQSAFEIKELL